ncbi:MAG: GNAT family N-acetyltransferase [Alphaproteobacteria bacterium]|nr:GNAT family N-acetyltransferase [Alphaproteobacteria bacterium]
MSELELYAARPGQDYDADWWAAVHVLYEEAFPGLPAGIERAATLGWPWPEMTTPFALFEGARCVAHVGLLMHPILVGGARVEVAGIHAVCTAGDRRRRGLCRQLLSEALAFADARCPLAKLCTDDPPVYSGHGFRVTPTWRFRSQLQPAAGVRRRRLLPLSHPEDAALLRDLLARRAPVSHHFASADSGWLVGIDAALSRLVNRLDYLPEHDAIVCIDDAAERSLVVEVIAETLPPAEVVLGVAEDPAKPALWTFTPDRFEPEALPEPTPEAQGGFMVRGDWPVAAPFGLSPLWEH